MIYKFKNIDTMKEIMIRSKSNPNDKFRVTTQTFELLKSSHELVVEREDLPLLDVDPNKVVTPSVVDATPQNEPPQIARPEVVLDRAIETKAITTPEPAKAKAIPSPKKTKKNADKK
jgi:hypothetical protein